MHNKFHNMDCTVQCIYIIYIIQSDMYNTYYIIYYYFV